MLPLPRGISENGAEDCLVQSNLLQSPLFYFLPSQYSCPSLKATDTLKPLECLVSDDSCLSNSQSYSVRQGVSDHWRRCLGAHQLAPTAPLPFPQYTLVVPCIDFFLASFTAALIIDFSLSYTSSQHSSSPKDTTITMTPGRHCPHVDKVPKARI